MLGMMMIAVALTGTNPGPVAKPRITEGAGTISEGTAPRAERIYCVKQSLTGTRLARKKCQSRADWIREGADPELFN